MEANELRLGNWVKVEFDYEVVKAINETTLWCALGGKGEGCMQLHSDVFPILLEEKWLVKFGFRYIGSAPTLGINESWNRGNIKIEQLQSKDLVFHGLQIKYVHQLQNLYFALTNSELTINN